MSLKIRTGSNWAAQVEGPEADRAAIELFDFFVSCQDWSGIRIKNKLSFFS